MADPGLVPGFIGVAIQMGINQFLHHFNIAVRCRKELSALKDVVIRIEPIISHIQQYRLEINRKRATSTSLTDNNVSAVNKWLKDLDALILQASQMAQQCTISSRATTTSKQEDGASRRGKPRPLLQNACKNLGKRRRNAGGTL